MALPSHHSWWRFPSPSGQRQSLQYRLANRPHSRTRHQKVHLFDVNLPGNTYRESSTVMAGTQLPQVYPSSELGTLGLSVCYDVRFPELYRHLAYKGADPVCPSCLHCLYRQGPLASATQARALKTPATSSPQPRLVSTTPCDSHTVAMIIDPWGVILAMLAINQGLSPRLTQLAWNKSAANALLATPGFV